MKTLFFIVPVAFIFLMLSCGSEEGTVASSKSGQQIYEMNCVQCHGVDGKLGLAGATDLSTSTLTPKGRKDIVKNGRGKMMPFNTLLTDEEIDRVVEYIATLKQ